MTDAGPGVGPPDLQVAPGSDPRTDPRVERTHADVHGAVIELLREDGLDAITHTRVAERSGVSRATIYRHFPDQPALLVSTLDAMRPVLAVPDRTGDPAVDARALIGVMAGHLNDNDMLVDMLVLLRDAETHPAFGVAREHLFPVQGNPVVALVLAGQEDGTLRGDVSPQVAAASLMGPVLAIRVMLRQRLTDDVLDDIVTIWAAGMRPV